jgi:hypothetical protein
MRHLVTAGLMALSLIGLASSPAASADPGTGNPQVQYRTFSCDDGNTYTATFVGFASGSFLLQDSTTVFAIKVFTEYFPSGEVKTFNYGYRGFDASTLLTCQYTDPQGVFNLFSGFFTPQS